MTKKEKLIYLAGMIDGDGHFCKPDTVNGRGEHHKYTRIIVVNTNIELIDWIKHNFEGNAYVYKKKVFNHKRMGRWSLQGTKATKLIARLLPYLIVRKQQALQAL